VFDFVQRPVTSHLLPHLFAIAVVLGALVWAPPTALILPVIMIVAGMYLRGSTRRARLGTYLLWGGVALAILTAIASYGADGGPGTPVIEPIHVGSRP
jgi:uncharacterized membrane protein